MASIRGTNLSAGVVPFTTDDAFATHFAKYGNGGWQEVANIAARDAITNDRREAGMGVYVTGEQKLYILNADLTTWTVFDNAGKIDTISVNNVQQEIVNKNVNITVPEVENSVTSASTTDALSAKMGKELNDRLDNVESRGRFLSQWNCTTGLPTTNPTTSPYTYQRGDYYIVGIVSSATPAVNYKPSGSSYTIGVASTTAETNTVMVDDTYIYDGTNWILQANKQRTVSFSQIAGQPSDNTNLATALNAKVDTTTLESDYRTAADQDIIDTQLSGEISNVVNNLTTHTSNTSNPHSVTKAQVGLGNCDNTSDANKPISTATQSALDLKANISSVPTKTAQLQNNGDGTSPFATQNYVNLYGGKIDKIKVNGTEQTITNKTVDIAVPTNNNQLANGAGYQTASDVSTAISTHNTDTTAHDDIRQMIEALDDVTVSTITKTTTNFTPGTTYSITQAVQRTADLFQGYKEDYIDPINSKIPTTATASNQLADKDFVNSSIQASAADFCGNFATWADVPTQASGYKVIPSTNDYMIVTNASDFAPLYSERKTYALNDEVRYNGVLYKCSTAIVTPEEFTPAHWTAIASSSYTGTWRFKYSGTWAIDGKEGWSEEYRVGNAFTAAQQAAIDSGVTSTMVTNYLDPNSMLATAYNPRITAVETNKRTRIFATSKMYGTDNTGADTAYSAGSNISFNNNEISVYGVAQQITEFPQASASNVGMIAQYMGTTTETLTHGFMYQVEAVYDVNATPPASFTEFTFDKDTFVSTEYGDYVMTHPSATFTYTQQGLRSWWVDPFGGTISNRGMSRIGFEWGMMDEPVAGDTIVVARTLSGYEWKPYAGVVEGNDKIDITNNAISAVNVVGQYDNMPTASASHKGQIVQAGDSNLLGITSGYFYRCDEDLDGTTSELTASEPSHFEGLALDFSTFYDNYLAWFIEQPESPETITYNSGSWTFSSGEMTMDDDLSSYGITWDSATLQDGDTLTVEWEYGYVWNQINVQDGIAQYYDMPDASAHYGEYAQYLGGIMNQVSYKDGIIYHATDYYDEMEERWNYRWEAAKVQQSALQYTDMPEASESNENEVVQYIGVGAMQYTLGHFYMCRYNAMLDTYSWQDITAAGKNLVAGDGIQLQQTSTQATINVLLPKTGSTLSTSGWSNNQYTLQLSSSMGITASSTVIVSPAVSSTDAWVNFGIKCIAQGTGTLTFSCTSTPDEDISVIVVRLP